MLRGYENKRLKINTPLRGYDAGAEINIKTDKKGVPVDPYWRNRVKDAAIDGCVEIKSKPATKPKESKKGDK